MGTLLRKYDNKMGANPPAAWYFWPGSWLKSWSWELLLGPLVWRMGQTHKTISVNVSREYKFQIYGIQGKKMSHTCDWQFTPIFQMKTKSLFLEWNHTPLILYEPVLKVHFYVTVLRFNAGGLHLPSPLFSSSFTAAFSHSPSHYTLFHCLCPLRERAAGIVIYHVQPDW